MKGHRYDDLHWHRLGFQVFGEQLGQRRRQRLEVVVLELMNRVSHYLLESEEGTNTIDVQFPLQAKGTTVLFNQGPTTLGTQWRHQAGKGTTTRDTQKATLSATANTMRRKKQINEFALKLV